MDSINSMAKAEKAGSLQNLERSQLARVTGGFSNFGGAWQLVLGAVQPPLVSGSSPSGSNLALIQPIPGCGGFTGC
jgi:hypothetical protein